MLRSSVNEGQEKKNEAYKGPATRFEVATIVEDLKNSGRSLKK